MFLVFHFTIVIMKNIYDHPMDTMFNVHRSQLFDFREKVGKLIVQKTEGINPNGMKRFRWSGLPIVL